jgi:hypothetical protein
MGFMETMLEVNHGISRQGACGFLIRALMLTGRVFNATF